MKNFSLLDEFVKTHTTNEVVAWVSGNLREMSSIISNGTSDPAFTLGALSFYIANTSHVAKLLDKQLNNKEDSQTVVA